MGGARFLSISLLRGRGELWQGKVRFCGAFAALLV